MTPSEEHIQGLNTLIQLERLIRRAETASRLSFILVNDTRQLISYRQAVFWRQGPGGAVRIEAASGVDRPDPRAPYADFLGRLIRHLLRGPKHKSVHIVRQEDMDNGLQAEWREWDMGKLILWCPLPNFSGNTASGLLFWGDAAWRDSEISLLGDLADCCGHALYALARPRRLFSLSGRRPYRHLVRLLLLIAAITVLRMPVRLSALAPFEIVPRNPHMVSAPQAGVIQSFHVEPNQPVEKGQLLLRLDDTAARNNHEMARKALNVMEEEHRRVKQKAFADEASRAHLLHLEARIEQQRAEVEYMRELLGRMDIKAEKGGTTIFASKADWLGRPVTVGEKILVIADPDEVEADIRLPANDAIQLDIGARALLFFSIAPEKPVEARVREASYEATISPEGFLAFRQRAALDEQEKPPRIGLRGTAKLYGQEVSLLYFLLRRPLAAFRQSTGI